MKPSTIAMNINVDLLSSNVSPPQTTKGDTGKPVPPLKV